MCSPAFPWEWLTLDTAYALALLGGALVMRAEPRSPFAWILFFLLSVTAGAFCIVGTQMALGAFGSGMTATAATGAAATLPC